MSELPDEIKHFSKYTSDEWLTIVGQKQSSKQPRKGMRTDPGVAAPKRSKFNNVKVTSPEGFKFDSKREYCRYAQLKLLEKAGTISDLRLQPKFTLAEKFVDESGEKHRAITYKADFQYTENGREIVEDVKGVRTKEFNIKWKLVKKQFPEVEFRLWPEPKPKQ